MIRGFATVGLPMMQSIAMIFSSFAFISYRKCEEDEEEKEDEGEDEMDKYERFRKVLFFCVIAVVFHIIIAIILFTKDPLSRLLFDVKENGESIYPKSESEAVNIDFQELQIMFREEYIETENANCIFQGFCDGNFKPLMWMILIRISCIMTSFPVLFIYSSATVYRERPFESIILICFVKLITLQHVAMFIDKLGRKWLLVVSGIGFCVLLMILIGRTSITEIEQSYSYLVAVITIALHAFASLGIDPIQHIYAVESFGLSKRNASLAFVTIIEYILHAILIYCFMSAYLMASFMPFFISPVAGMFLVVMSIKLPETKFLSLRDCRDAFKFFNFYSALGILSLLICRIRITTVKKNLKK